MPITFEPIPEWLQDELTEQVSGFLLRLGIPKTIDGHVYLAYAIAETIQDQARTDFITKELYPDIARQYSTTASCVERSMRTAVMRCWKSEREALCEIAGTMLTERPTNSEFIQFVARHIRNR